MTQLIRKTTTPTINWNKVQLLESKYSEGLVVLTTGAHEENDFEGVVIHSPKNFYVGELEVDWAKSSFKPFEGQVILDSDSL